MQVGEDGKSAAAAEPGAAFDHLTRRRRRHVQVLGVRRAQFVPLGVQGAADPLRIGNTLSTIETKVKYEYSALSVRDTNYSSRTMVTLSYQAKIWCVAPYDPNL